MKLILIMLLSTFGVDGVGMPKPQLQQLLAQHLGLATDNPVVQILTPGTAVDGERSPAALSPVRTELAPRLADRSSPGISFIGDIINRNLENIPGARSRPASRHSSASDHSANEFSVKCREIDLEIKRIESEREVQLKRMEWEVRLKQLELEQATLQNTSVNVDHSRSGPIPVPAFRIETATKRLPRFSENAVEEFFMAADRTAVLNNWPNDKLTAIIQPVLVGKALKHFWLSIA